MFTDAEILEEVRKIQYFYQLKREIRYGETRTDMGESVAEHVYGMQVLALYFSELEDTQKSWNYRAIYEMITWHDMDEVETGDVIGYLKTPQDRANEDTAMDTVLLKSPDTIRDRITGIIKEYQAQKTIESRFVKALDKIEPLFQVYNENGKNILLRNKTTLEDSRRIKDAYVAEFSYLKRFNEVLNTAMDTEGFFTKLHV